MADSAAPPTESTTVPTGEPPPYALSQKKMFMDTFVFLFMLFAIFYFLLIRPQQKRIRVHKNLLSSLQKGNKVMTGGGIIGTVTKFEGDDIVVVEIAQGVKVRVA